MRWGKHGEIVHLHDLRRREGGVALLMGAVMCDAGSSVRIVLVMLAESPKRYEEGVRHLLRSLRLRSPRTSLVKQQVILTAASVPDPPPQREDSNA